MLPGESQSDFDHRMLVAQLWGTPLDTPHLSAVVIKAVFEHGYFTTTGTVENTGAIAAFSPAIELRIHDHTGKVLLASDTAHAAGTMLAELTHGQKSAFEHVTRVPGDHPWGILWKICVPGFPSQVTLPKGFFQPDCEL